VQTKPAIERWREREAERRARLTEQKDQLIQKSDSPQVLSTLSLSSVQPASEKKLQPALLSPPAMQHSHETSTEALVAAQSEEVRLIYYQ